MAGSRKSRDKSGAPTGERTEKHTEGSKIVTLVCIVWAGLTLFHATKAFGFFPLILPDEYTYISDIRHRTYAEALIPNYLYYAVYSLTSFFGGAFLDGGRILNSVVFMLSAPFIYATAKQVCHTRVALVLTLLVMASPISSYTAYFMPESLYFTGFWALTWFCVGRNTSDDVRKMFIVGLAMGLLALIKVHGIFLVPGFFIYTFLTAVGENWKSRLLRAVQLFTAGLGGFLLARLGVGILFAGSSGLHMLGSAYGDLSDEAQTSIKIFSLAANVLYNLAGNVVGMGLIMGIPMLCSIFCLVRVTPSEQDMDGGKRLRRMTVFAFSFLVPLLLVSAVFCGMMAENFPEEYTSEATRIQWRFYNFIFPIFLIVAVGVLATLRPGEMAAWRGKWLFLIPIGCGVFAAATGFAGYSPAAMPDCPELGSLYSFPTVFLLYSVLYATFGAACIIRPGPALRAYLFGLMPLAALIGTGITQHSAVFGFGIFPDIYDKAGMFAKEYLGQECRDLTVVDGFINSGKKTLIHIDNPATDLMTQLDNTVPVEIARVRPGKNWLLLMGDFFIPAQYDKFSIVYTDPAQTKDLTAYMRAHKNSRVMLRYALVRITAFDYSVDLRGKSNLWPISGVSINAGTAAIDYAIPLSGKYSITIDAVENVSGFDLTAIDETGKELTSITLDGKENAVLDIPPHAKAHRLVLQATSASAHKVSEIHRLNIVSENTN